MDRQASAFDSSRKVMRLIDLDRPLIARSEARSLAHDLDRYREVVVDFDGIEQVGQGFADELFRVWARDNPRTELVPVNMNRAVRLMVGRALADADRGSQSPGS